MLIIVLVIFSGILLPFVLALFFAYLVYPVVRWLNRIHIKRLRVPRWVAILIVYFAVGFGISKLVPLAFAGVTREFASLFHEIPNLFKGLKTQKEKLYTAIESKLRYDAVPPEVRHEIEGEFLRTWALRHPKLKEDGTPVGPDQAQAARPDALPPFEEESPAFLAFKNGFFDYLTKVVEAPDTYEIVIAGSPKEVAPLEQLKRLEQRIAAIVREIRDHISERKYEDLEKDLREAFDIAARESQSVDPLEGNDLAERPKPVHMALVDLWRATLQDQDPRITLADVDDLSRRIRDSLVQAFSGEKLAGDVRQRLDDYIKTMQAAIIGHLERISSAIPGIIRGIFTFFVVLMIAAFFIVFFPKIKAYGRDLFPPEYQDDYESVLLKIDARLSGVIRGQFIICFVNALLTYAGLAMLGLPLAPTLAAIAGVLSLIPIFGTILSTIPAVVVALSVSPESGSAGGFLAQYLGADNNRILLALAVIGWVCIIHAIESYILNPNIMGQSAHMNPLIIVFALLAGEHVGGIIGALLAVPIGSIFVTLFAYLHRKTVESIEAQSSGGGPVAGT